MIFLGRRFILSHSISDRQYKIMVSIGKDLPNCFTALQSISFNQTAAGHPSDTQLQKCAAWMTGTTD